MLGGRPLTEQPQHNVAADIQRLNQENIEVKRRIKKLEDSDERHDKDIRGLYTQAEGTKVYVTQILNSLQQLETKLFGLITNLTTSQDTERNAERQERSQSASNWISFSKYVIGATIGIAILYLFQQGGK